MASGSSPGLADWLRALGLERYVTVFEEHEIDAETVKHLTEEDLKEMGLPVGPRRKILASRSTAIVTDTSVKSHAAERRHLTVMFVDLVGSTNLSTRIDPEILNELLKAYKSAVAAEITIFNGTVAKYLGDGVLAYFGWPEAHEDAAESSLRAAFAILKSVARLTDPQGVPLQCRIGIATGLVVVGEVSGTGTAREDSVAGETLNLAARLQSLADPDGIVIADSTYRVAG